jgi:hypothetical protein
MVSSPTGFLDASSHKWLKLSKVSGPSKCSSKGVVANWDESYCHLRMGLTRYDGNNSSSNLTLS